DILFEPTAEHGRIARELQKGEIFEPYEHLLDTDAPWIGSLWEHMAASGYTFVLPEGDRLRTALDCDKVLTSFDADPTSNDPFVTLYSSRGWNIGRRGRGIKSVLGIEDWHNFDGEHCKQKLNAAIVNLEGYNPSTDRCDKFLQSLMFDHHWLELPDIT